MTDFSSDRPTPRRRPTRRRRPPEETRPRDWSFLRVPIAALAVTAIVVVIASLIAWRTPEPPPPDPIVQPVASALAVCPKPGESGTDLFVRVTAATVPGLPGQESGQARLFPLTGSGNNKEFTEPGEQTQLEFNNTNSPPVLGLATGGVAPGFIADQRGRDARGTGRGMSSVACSGAGSDFWFIGGGAVIGQRSRIYLTNTDDFPAQVDLKIYTSAGPIETDAARGVVVPPKDQVTLNLDALAPRIEVAAVRVQARSGRVSAAMSDEVMAGLRSKGADWLPVAARPATKVLVPGVFNGGGARNLSVLVPGKEGTEVTIRALTSDGAFVPVGAELLTLAPGELSTINLAKALDGQAATIELTATQPIVAGMRQEFGKGERNGELAFTAGTVPWQGTGAVSGLPTSSISDVRLWVTAPEADANVTVSLIGYADGTSQPPSTAQDVSVKAGQSVKVDITPPAGADWYTAVVTTKDQPVLVAHRVVERSRFGDLITGYPWSPVRVTVSTPVAQEDLDAAFIRESGG